MMWSKLVIVAAVCVLVGCASKRPTSSTKPAMALRSLATPIGPVTVAEEIEIKPDYLDYAEIDGMRILWNAPTIDPRPLVPSKPVELYIMMITGQSIKLQFEEQLFRSWPCVKIGPWITDGEESMWCQYINAPPVLYGDVTKDGFRNQGDIIMATNCQGTPPTEECWACDLDRDGDVDAADLKAVKEAQR